MKIPFLPIEIGHVTHEKDVATVDDGSRRFSVGERRVAYWAISVAGLAIAGLVISLVSKHSDRLATVALILAAVAFVLQIGFFVIQLWIAQEQDRRSRETYSGVLDLLTKIDTRSLETTDVIKGQFRFVLEHAFALRRLPPPSLAEAPASDSVSVEADPDSDTPEGPNTGLVGEHAAKTPDPVGQADRPPDDWEDKLQAAVGEAIRAYEARVTSLNNDLLQRWDRVSTAATDRDRRARSAAGPGGRLARVFRTWPPEEAGKAALQVWAGLSPVAQSAFRSLAYALDRAIDRSGVFPQWVVYSGSPVQGLDELADNGLAEVEALRDDHGKFRPRAKLTLAGRQVARLLVAQGPVPDWLSSSGRMAEFERPTVTIPPLPPIPRVEQAEQGPGQSQADVSERSAP